jgi:hypothetical protein
MKGDDSLIATKQQMPVRDNSVAQTCEHMATRLKSLRCIALNGRGETNEKTNTRQ